MTQPTHKPAPLPIGYVELQASYVGPFDVDTGLTLYGDLMHRAASEYPGYVVHGSRWEDTVDGAGLEHHNFYMGFQPPRASSEPLNPHNMNDAPMPQSGDPAPTDGSLPIGWKEVQFNRGT